MEHQNIFYLALTSLDIDKSTMFTISMAVLVASFIVMLFLTDDKELLDNYPKLNFLTFNYEINDMTFNLEKLNNNQNKSILSNVSYLNHYVDKNNHQQSHLKIIIKFNKHFTANIKLFSNKAIVIVHCCNHRYFIDTNADLIKFIDQLQLKNSMMTEYSYIITRNYSYQINLEKTINLVPIKDKLINELNKQYSDPNYSHPITINQYFIQAKNIERIVFDPNLISFDLKICQSGIIKINIQTKNIDCNFDSILYQIQKFIYKIR